MAHAENEVLINRPAADVFAFLGDGLNNPKWRPGVLSIELHAGNAGEVGAEYSQQLKGPGGRPIAGDYRITKADRGHQLDFAVTAGPARPVGSYVMTGTPFGTKLRFSLDLVPKGLMRLMTPMIQKTMESEVDQLAALKTLLERNGSGVQ